MNKKPITDIVEDLPLSMETFERELGCLTQITSGLLASGKHQYTTPGDLANTAEKIMDELHRRALKRTLKAAIEHANYLTSKGVEVSTLLAAEPGRTEPHKSLRTVKARRLKMKLDRSTRKTLSAVSGAGLRVYGEREIRDTQQALARFNVRLRERSAQRMPPVVPAGGHANE